MSCEKHGKHNKTTSVGFCFAEVTDVRTPDKWLRKLMGIRPCEYCMEFDTDDFKEPLTESRATYTHDTDFDKRIEVREWCTTTYSLATHPYIRLGKCPSLQQLLIGEHILWIDRAELEEVYKS